MFKLNDDLLRELGLGALPPHEKNAMLKHIYDTLELRVGMQLAEKMSEQQLNEFEQLMPTETDTLESKQVKEKQALTWLETNFPNYKQVVADELEKLKIEIKQAAPQILAASQQHAAEQAAPQAQMPPAPPSPSQQPPMPLGQAPPDLPQPPSQTPPTY